MPQSAITLHGGPAVETPPSTAVLLRLSDSTVKQVRQAARTKDSLLFVAGASPNLRIGSHTIPLTLSTDAFRNELYASTTPANLDLEFTTLITHRAAESNSNGGTDEALAELQKNMAAYQQEKAANQTNITNAILPATAANSRTQKPTKSARPLGGSQGLTSSSVPSSASTPLIAPALGERATRLQAMRVPVIHLLAAKPCSETNILSITHIPKLDLDAILPKLARLVNGAWALTDRAYRELDPHAFAYHTSADRKSAIDNAVRAYDRLRLAKEDKLWQTLLPPSERGKGVVLSRLQANRDLTPHLSPMPQEEGESVGTPRIGGVTPRGGAAGKKGIMERMTNPKKRAAEDAKVRKRKEREAAAEEKVEKKQRMTAGKKAGAGGKMKSEERVFSSDDESGEVSDAPNASSRLRADLKIAPEKKSAAARTPQSGTPYGNSKDGPAKRRADPAAGAKGVATAKRPNVSTPNATSAGKSTPQPQATTTTLSAPDSRHKSQLSPSKGHSRPHVPSPLGAARPRVASDVSDRNAVGVRQRAGTGTPKGLGITTADTKRRNVGEDGRSVEEEKRTGSGDGAVRAGNSHAVKRKAPEASDSPAAKHRKTVSHSSTLNGARTTTGSTTAPASSRTPSLNSSSDSTLDPAPPMTFAAGVQLAQKFQDQYYPTYARLYDEQAERASRGERVSVEEREKLLAMHRRLEQMKREIEGASSREGMD